MWPQSVEWLKACNVKKEDHHGGSFAGSDSRKLLQNVELLEALNSSSSCGKFVSAFKSSSDVVTSCPETELHSEFQCKIVIFAYLHKVYEVMFHVAEFCLMMSRDLGPLSEQTGDVHHDFKETWQRYKEMILIDLFVEKTY